MKYREAQLITEYTTLSEDGKHLCYMGVPVDTIPIAAWESWMNEEKEAEKKTFFSMMLQRALKAKKHP